MCAVTSFVWFNPVLTPMPGLFSTWVYVEANETLHPIAIRLLGVQAVMYYVHHVAHLVEELFLLAGGRGGF